MIARIRRAIRIKLASRRLERAWHAVATADQLYTGNEYSAERRHAYMRALRTRELARVEYRRVTCEEDWT